MATATTLVDQKRKKCKKHGWQRQQARNEVEYFMEEILPDISEKEKGETIELFLKVFYL